MKIPIIDLKIQYQNLKNDIDNSIQTVLNNCNFILGKEVVAFEEEMTKYLNIKYALGVSSGTDAITLALLALGIGYGDEIITTPYTFFATTETVSLVGARPVFVDIDPKTLNIDVKKIEKAITPRTKAIIPVHIYGQACFMPRILEIAKKYNLKIIEDVDQALGAEQDNKKAGTFGDISTYSFFPSKNLGGFGDGGMVVTNNPDLALKLRQLRNHGDESRYTHVRIGLNARLDTLQAAVLSIKLKHLDEWINLRIKKADLYSQLLKDCDLILPYKEKFNKHSFNLYTIRIKNRDKLKAYLESKEIGTAIHYPIPLHLQKVYSHLGYKPGDLPIAEKASQEVISLPLYPEISDDAIKIVCAEIKEFLNKNY